MVFGETMFYHIDFSEYYSRSIDIPRGGAHKTGCIWENESREAGMESPHTPGLILSWVTVVV